MRWRELRPIPVLMLLAWAAAARAGDEATSTPTSTPTSKTRPLPAPLSRAVAIEPTGPALLSPEGETVVDPAATFEVELPARLPDVRLVLLDAADAHVAARGAQELGATTRLALAPAAPLVPGSRYVLRVEGAASRELRDGDRVFQPRAFALLAAGTPPPPEPKAKPKKKRRRR